MDDQTILRQMHNWGYQLVPDEFSHNLGGRALLVALRSQPTRVHFDPETLHLRLQEGDIAQWVTLTFHSLLRESCPVCPGRVTLSDRRDKKVNFFTFGGQLDACADDEEVVYTLNSPAPVLELTGKLDSLPDQFAAEVEVMMGVFQARWGIDDRGFSQRLAELDPLQFYIGSLESLLLRFGRAPALRDTFHDLYQVMKQEKEELIEAGQWPKVVATLGQLFGNH